MEINKKQKEIIETKYSKVVVNCAAASGKTFCLIKRLEFLINKYPNSNIVVITFTNAAAEEIKKRLLKIPSNTFIGTIHGYCNYLLLSNGIVTDKIIDNGEFDELFSLFRKNNIKKRIDFLLLDEGQDSTLNEFTFLLEDLNPKNWIIFSDKRQSIYGFRNACPEYLDKLVSKNDVHFISLNINYRCKYNILIFAKNIINKLGYRFEDNSIADKKGGNVFEVEFTPENVLKIIQNSIKNEPKNEENNTKYNYKDWFILVRTNDQLNIIYNYLIKNNIPCDTFRQSDLSNSELEKKKQENTVKILTIHSAKGLENKNVIVGSFHFSSKDEERRLAYVAATRAIDNLYWFKPKNKKRKPKIENWED